MQKCMTWQKNLEIENKSGWKLVFNL
jgi:hypothetical protein